MWLAGCFFVGGGQVHWALDAILGHKNNQPVCPDLHTNGWALSGLGSELPAGPSSASFTVQEPPFNGVRVRQGTPIGLLNQPSPCAAHSKSFVGHLPQWCAHLQLHRDPCSYVTTDACIRHNGVPRTHNCATPQKPTCSPVATPRYPAWLIMPHHPA